jgi:simple sugar transport system permease protein
MNDGLRGNMSERVVARLLSHRDIAFLVLIALIVMAVFTLTTDTFLTAISFQVMGFQVAEVALLSLAVMLSMLTGGIDLSVVSISAISAIVIAKLFAMTDAATTGTASIGIVLAICAAGLATGAACGVLNGFLIARLRITPILATLATLQILNGIGIGWTGGNALYGMPDNFLNIGGGYVAKVPIPIIVLAGGAILTAIFVNRTGMGLRLKLIGASETAAHYSGLNPRRVLYATYIASGLLASLAGIVIASHAASASADYGTSYLLLAIVIVVLGGVNPLGGFGTVVGVLLSAFILQMVSTGFNMVGFNAFAYQIAQGAILIVVIGLNTLGQRYGGGWRTGLLALVRRRPPDAAAVEPPPETPPVPAASPPPPSGGSERLSDPAT